MTSCLCTYAQKMTGDGCEICNPSKAIEYAEETIKDLRIELDKAYAKIDALMLEYCPEEMTQEQKDNWAYNQRKVVENDQNL